jgi:hypothetical protein
MKRSLFSLLAAAILTLSMVGGASAEPKGLGAPGENNCVGLSTQFIAKDPHNFGMYGIGNLRKITAEINPLHETNVLLVVQGYCGTGNG